jgi:hypothetical protein
VNQDQVVKGQVQEAGQVQDQHFEVVLVARHLGLEEQRAVDKCTCKLNLVLDQIANFGTVLLGALHK